MKKNTSDNTGKRPDIAIFNEEGVAVIIEFKAPDVEMVNHIGDLNEYAQLIVAKSKGKIKRVYAYLIGGSLNPNRLRGFKKFSNNKGWFQTSDIDEPETGITIGQQYSEILFYDHVVDRADVRLAAFKDRLKLDLWYISPLHITPLIEVILTKT